MDPAVKAKRRENAKKRVLMGKMFGQGRDSHAKRIRASFDAYIIPCLGTLLDLVTGEDVATSQQCGGKSNDYCEYSTWVREKHCVEAKLFELRAKLKTIVIGLREVTTRLHEDLGTKRLSFVQNGKSFSPTPKNGCA